VNILVLIRRCRLAFLVAITSLVCISAPARAADPAIGSDAFFFHLTAGGVDRIDAALKRGGFDGFNKLVDSALEGLPFIPAAAVDRSAPAAAYFTASDELGGSTIIAVPLKPGTVPLRAFEKDGAKRLPGHDDTVATDTYGFRRTPHYLLFGNSQRIVDPTEASIAKPVADPRVLMNMELDLKAARTAAPKKMAEFLDQIAGQPRPGEPPGTALGRRIVSEPFRKAVDNLRLTLLADKETCTLHVEVRPLALKTPVAKYPRPRFPEDCFAQMHYTYPAKEAISAIAETYASIARDVGIDKDPAKMKKGLEYYNTMLEFLVGDAVSMAAAPSGDTFVIYVVIQTEQPRDNEKLLTRLEKGLHDLGIIPEGTPPWTRSTYMTNEKKVDRLVLADAGKPVIAYIDLLARDNQLLMTISLKDSQHISRLLPLEPKGMIEDILRVDADVPALRKLILSKIDKGPGGPANVIEKLFAAGTLQLKLNGDGKALLLDLQAPLSFLGEGMKRLAAD
jgi:hypothetical protein